LASGEDFLGHLQVHVPLKALKTVIEQEKEQGKEQGKKREEEKEERARSRRPYRPLVRNPNWGVCTDKVTL
jgi:hypothetical protein